MSVIFRAITLVAGVVFASACSNSSSSDASSSPDPKQTSEMNNPFVEWEATESVFVKKVHLKSDVMQNVTQVTFTVLPKEGALAEPLNIAYQANSLSTAVPFYSDNYVLPIYGLYADHSNQIQAQFTKTDGSEASFVFEVQTEAFVDSTNIYDQPISFSKNFDASNKPDMNYFLLQSANSGQGMGPVIFDIDGQVRHAADTSLQGTLMATHFENNHFIVGHGATPIEVQDAAPEYHFYRFYMDGERTYHSIQAFQGANAADVTLYRVHHAFRPGKDGLLMQFYVKDNPTDQKRIEDYVAEVDTNTATVIREWDLLKIFKDHIDAEEGAGRGAQFARLGQDWCHTNDAIYDSSDHSLVVSCREAFVVKIGYDDQQIKWLLGDTTKFWGTFPSLVSKALTVSADTVPIGQHSLSITDQGELLLFNNGFQSRWMPTGESAGASRAYSMAQKFAIDTQNMTATETWRYDAGQAISSTICSSVQAHANGNYLVQFSSAENKTKSILHLIDASQNLLMELTLPTTNCAASWNTHAIGIEHLIFN
jgi:arylsulfate sulfotransferase